MTRKLDRTQIARLAQIVPDRATLEAIPHPPRTFELPLGLYAATVGAYFGFLAVTAVGFASPGLIIPIAICAIYITMAFGTPSLWTRIRGEEASQALSLSEFRRRGIVTATGHCDAASATLQVLILPAVILFWGVATALLYAMLT